MKYRIKIFSFILAALILISGCSEKTDTPTSGSLIVYVDESIYPVVSESANEFMRLYKESSIEVIPVSTRKGLVKLLNNETKIFIGTRDFNSEEIEFYKKSKLEIRKLKYCYDGIAVITSLENRIKEINIKVIGNILSNKDKSIKAVLPGKNSGVNEYLRTRFLDGKDIENCEIVNKESEILKSIRNSNFKCGFVSYNLLDDSANVNIVNVGLFNIQDSTINYFEPHPGYFIKDIYPLSRLVLIFLNELKQGIASGFATFLTSNEGQKIVLNNKLGPAAVPVRLIPYN